MRKAAGKPILVSRCAGALRRAAAGLRDACGLLGRIHRRQAVELTVLELRELENSFMLLLNGAFTGLPAPPSFLAAELLPYLEHEWRVAEARAEAADDALAEMAGMLDIG